jgi:hypothetical protein
MQNDPRVTRQTTQAIAALLLAAVGPAIIAKPFDWRVLVGSLIATLVALLTNPRLVAGVENVMPAKGSSTYVVDTAAPAPSPTPTPVTSPQTPRAKDSGVVEPSVVLTAIFCALACAFAWLFGASMAHAECQTVSPTVYRCGKLTLQPSFAAAAGQINVRKALDSGLGSAYQRVSLLAGYGVSYHGEALTVGASVYGGVGIAANQPNAPQANLLITFADMIGIGPGVTTFQREDGTRVYQALISLAVNYSAGGTTAKVLPWMDRLIAACVGAACVLP